MATFSRSNPRRLSPDMDEPPKPFSSSVANPKQRESDREIEGQREKEK
jgi:hypothetical protein